MCWIANTITRVIVELTMNSTLSHQLGNLAKTPKTTHASTRAATTNPAAEFDVTSPTQ